MTAPLLLALRVLLSLSLYAFLIFTLVLLWRGIKDQGNLLATRRIPPIRLILMHDTESSRQFYFNQPEITVGRDPGCDCQVDEDTVSARHARLSYHHTQWWIEDLHSTNGTLLNGEPLETPTVLTADDEISFGKVRVSIHLEIDTLDRLPQTPNSEEAETK